MKNLIVDYRISNEEKDELKLLGFNLLLCPPCNNLYNAVSGHPDMLLHVLDNKNIIVHKNMDSKFIETLKSLNINVTPSNTSLTSKYPKDIILNALNLPHHFIHSINHTDKELLKSVHGKKLIDVNQGYTKCSTAIVNDSSFITSDIPIAKKLTSEGFDVLLLPPGDIELPGLDYGFIGGSCGLIERNVLAFYGDLEYYSFGKDVLKFLKKHKVEPVFLRKGKLIDRGSIFRIK